MSDHDLPEILMKKVDAYVDSLAPHIQSRITEELEIFQQKTIDALEDQVKDAFHKLFNKDEEEEDDSRDFKEGAPESYGGLSMPFADEIAKLTRSFKEIAAEAGDDLQGIFDITEEAKTKPREVKKEQEKDEDGNFFSRAIDAVQDKLDDIHAPDFDFDFGELLSQLIAAIKSITGAPEEKAGEIGPDIKADVAAKLRAQHAPIAERFTLLALEHIKRWLRENTGVDDLGDGIKGEFKEHLHDLTKSLGGLFGRKKRDDGDERDERDGGASARGFEPRDDDDDGPDGFSEVISDKLSVGLARVHREVRLEFRKILGVIERELFELLPDRFQGPLEKLLGGNPFDAELDREAEPERPDADRGWAADLKWKLIHKIRGLVRKVQETLREGVLGVVNGGHRKFEKAAWLFVQNMAEEKVQKYLPKIKIDVPDDIGDENVSVGEPVDRLGGDRRSQRQPEE
ncbi:hypothetical protein F4780DRAFT_736942 [Xylariomycetidae sp. FL0641]|nr:hypothetical protein F4780DRAFT_736942 [Xylariomycetidae sp. FL0641]